MSAAQIKKRTSGRSRLRTVSTGANAATPPVLKSHGQMTSAHYGGKQDLFVQYEDGTQVILELK